MQRVMIIGSNGAGKSAFSYILAEKTGLPLALTEQVQVISLQSKK